MRRNARALILIVIILAICTVTLSVKKIHFNNFERGSDTPLGLSLGLDLQGGSHLVYQAALKDPDTGLPKAVTSDQMASLVRTIERRINSSGLGEPIIQILGEDRLLVQLPGVRDPGRAKTLIGETARLEFKHRDLNVPPEELDIFTGQDVISISAEDVTTSGVPVGDLKLEGSATSTPDAVTYPAIIIEFTDTASKQFYDVVLELQESYLKSMNATLRGDLLPADSLELNFEGQDSLRFNVTGNLIMPIATSTKYIVYMPVDSTDLDYGVSTEETKSKLGVSPKVTFLLKRGSSDEDIGLTGDDLANAYASQHQTSGAPIVNIEFNSDGTKLFGELTTKIVATQERTGIRDQIAIILDGDELIAPVVTTPITAGTAIIQGADFTLERVRDLALLLESGRLPIPIELIQERDVDAMLGADSLAKSVLAGGTGLILVLLFMTLYYRVPGFVASLALILYAGMVLSIFKLIPITLTLSGVAAAILSIGMAVDANILIFERMKDELRAGRTMLSAINIGFNRAWPAIRDGNVSTLITCAILFWFSDQLGATIVQGFAVTLAVGVIISMFSAIVISRTMLRILALSPLSKKIKLFMP